MDRLIMERMHWIFKWKWYKWWLHIWPWPCIHCKKKTLFRHKISKKYICEPWNICLKWYLVSHLIFGPNTKCIEKRVRIGRHISTYSYRVGFYTTDVNIRSGRFCCIWIFSFVGYIYWRYEGTTLLDRKHIRYLGMQNLDITAAVWWKRNHKTYLFSSKFSQVAKPKSYLRYKIH